METEERADWLRETEERADLLVKQDVTLTLPRGGRGNCLEEMKSDDWLTEQEGRVWLIEKDE